jgi:hypothetical protein
VDVPSLLTASVLIVTHSPAEQVKVSGVTRRARAGAPPTVATVVVLTPRYADVIVPLPVLTQTTCPAAVTSATSVSLLTNVELVVTSVLTPPLFTAYTASWVASDSGVHVTAAGVTTSSVGILPAGRTRTSAVVT